MAGSQQDERNLSLILSEVLSDVGVNEEMVMRRRNGVLLRESILGVSKTITGIDIFCCLFGSQSEGTTTLGLRSDVDALMCISSRNVIQDWADWKPHVINLLMVQDETTAPGYCLLQRLQNDAPLPVSYVANNEYYKDSKGRILLKNTKYHGVVGKIENSVQNGPALTIPGGEHEYDADSVPAFHCERWPREGRQWLHRRSVSGWPSIQLKTVSERSGCFLVPVGSKCNVLNELEWRISTSSAERYLMFSLNITHLRCYVLMKLLLKSHINRGCDNVISSYMCKTAVLHCVENTDTVLWQGHNLLLCLNQILRELYTYVLNINCPHFIIPENNLMAGRISAEQQQRLLGNINHIINSDDSMLFEIQTDNIGSRLKLKLNIIQEIPVNLPSAAFIRKNVSSQIMTDTAREIILQHILNMKKINNEDNIREVIQHFLYLFNRSKEQYAVSSHSEQEVYRLMLPLMCSTIGSLLVTFDIMLNKPFSDIAFEWFKLGVDSDISSSWLKLATAYYRTGNNNATEVILRNVGQRYDRNVVKPVCACHRTASHTVPGFDTLADQLQTDVIGSYVSYCVSFMRCEANIVPHELQQEYSRSTQEDIQTRNCYDNHWMDFAVVDSLPYLYFLQYKTYGRLNNRREQERALHKLQQVIRDERNLKHKETALNLLGQCLEQEGKPDEAYKCYESSLLERRRNNAAKKLVITSFMKFLDGFTEDDWINFMK